MIGSWNESKGTSNTMKAYPNESILHQYFFDTNYFQLLMGLRSFQKSVLKVNNFHLPIYFANEFQSEN